MSLDAGQSEQRHEARDDDGGGEEDRLADLGGGDRNDSRLAAKAAAHAHAVQGARPVTQVRGGFGQMPEDVLHHDDGGIDDQAEIDGADRQQIRRLAAQHHEADGEGQRERYGHRDDDGAAQIAEKHPLQQENQHDARNHVVQHGVRRDVDQIAAVVDALDADAGRQNAAAVDLVHFRLDPLDRGHALRAAPHQHDALDDVVDVVEARNAEARQIADAHRGHVADHHRRALIAGDHGVADFVRRMDQADAAHHGGLRAEIDRLAADIDVGVAERLQHLRHGQAVADELALVDGDVVGLGLAAPSGHIDHAGHRLEAPLQHPVLESLQVGDRIIRRPDHPIAIDLADGARRRDLRLRAVRQAASCDRRLVTHCSAWV